MSDAPLLLRQDDNGVTTLTLNRPQARNSLASALLKELLAAFAAIRGDESVRVVILAGAGPAFCSGHDLKELRAKEYDCDFIEELFSDCAQVMQAMVALPKPVIARVHGIATAAGCQLVASCDLAVAATDSRFATPGVNIGLFCSTPMVALSRNVAPKQAMQMLLMGDMIDAQTALRFGLVNELVAPEELEARTLSLARQIAAKSAVTLAIGKEAFYRQREMPLAEAYEYTREVMKKNLETLDAKEGISAFLDKRHPVWCGK